jgi:hypothetical protein
MPEFSLQCGDASKKNLQMQIISCAANFTALA